MTPDIVHEVLANDPHEVAAYVADVIGWIIFAHVRVDGRQPLRYCTGTVHGRLVDKLDIQVLAFGPAA